MDSKDVKAFSNSPDINDHLPTDIKREPLLHDSPLNSLKF
jgi:hypothetical protein